MKNKLLILLTCIVGCNQTIPTPPVQIHPPENVEMGQQVKLKDLFYKNCIFIVYNKGVEKGYNKETQTIVTVTFYHLMGVYTEHCNLLRFYLPASKFEVLK